MQSFPKTLNEPQWLNLDRGRPQRVSDRTWDWLRDDASLTRRVTSACPGHFRVRVVAQGWRRGLPSENHLLGVRLRGACLVREVELLCDELPQVFARTLMPARSLTGGARRLAYLRNKPLGAVLFADPHTVRHRVQIARFQSHHQLFQAATAHLEREPVEVWGRRTLFLYKRKPILVNELFLPALIRE